MVKTVGEEAANQISKRYRRWLAARPRDYRGDRHCGDDGYQLGREARSVASEALRRARGSHDALILGLTVARDLGDHALTVRRGRRLLALGPPPSDDATSDRPAAYLYTTLPRVWVAQALAELDQVDEALEVCRRGMAADPAAVELRALYTRLSAQARRPPSVLPLVVAAARASAGAH